jgi:hypothetical protein
MARGQSGKLIAEIDPALKRQFHAALTLDGSTFKDWVLENIHDYLEHRSDPELPRSGAHKAYVQGQSDLLAAEEPSTNTTQKNSEKT